MGALKRYGLVSVAALLVGAATLASNPSTPGSPLSHTESAAIYGGQVACARNLDFQCFQLATPETGACSTGVCWTVSQNPMVSKSIFTPQTQGPFPCLGLMSGACCAPGSVAQSNCGDG